MLTLISRMSCRILPAILVIQLARGCGQPQTSQPVEELARKEAGSKLSKIPPVPYRPTDAPIAEAGTKPDPRKTLIQSHIAEKKWEEAIRAADAAIAAGLGDADVYLAKGRAHEALDEADEAESAWLEAFAKNQHSAETLLLLVESMERRGRRERCEELCHQILDKVDPRCAAAREKLFALYLNGNHLDEARKCYAGFAKLGLAGPAAERCRAMLNLATSQLPESSQRRAVYQDELRKAAEDYPDDAATRAALAMSCFAGGDSAKAMTAVDEALKIDPENIRARELKVKLEADLLRFAEASAIVEGLLEDRPRDGGYLQQLLELATIQADYDTAVAVLRKLLERDDFGERRSLTTAELIEALLNARRFDEAVEVAKSWLAEAPDQSGRREAWLITLTRAGRHNEALEAVGRWLADDTTDAVLRNRYVAQLQAAGRNTEAQQQVLSWLADDPDDMGLNALLISLTWSSRQWDSAIEVAQTGAESPEQRTSYEALLGQSYVLARRFDEAIEFYRDRANTTATEGAYGDLLSVLVLAERFTEAEQLANKLVAVTSELIRRDKSRLVDPSALVSLRRQLASIYQLTDRHDQAAQQLQAIYELLPGDPTTCNDLGYTWADAGERIADAEQLIRFAVTKRPHEANYLDSLGWVLYKQGNFKEAIYYLRLAIRKSTDEDAVVLDHFGDALYRAGSLEEARDCWEKSSKLTVPDHDPPPDADHRRVHERVKAKLTQIADGREVETAPLASEDQSAASTQAVRDKPGQKDAKPADRERPSQPPIE